MNYSIIHRLIAKYRRFRLSRELYLYSRYQKVYDIDYSFTQAAIHFNNRNEIHAFAHHYFHHICPKELREHRQFFSSNGRGFGEDAFHAMWWMLIREFRPKKCLEIGVYRGQVISLWGLISKILDTPINIHGISPFSPIGDSVSTYPDDIDYLEDTKKAFNIFGLEPPILIQALSTDSLAVSHIKKHQWDLIYIDGGHDYEVVVGDYSQCVKQLKAGGLLVMDDSSLDTEFEPPSFSFAGHPGPSRVMKDLAMKELHFIGAVGHNNVFIKI